MAGDPPTAGVVDELRLRPTRTVIAGALARSLGVVTATLLVYALLPVEGVSSPEAVAIGAGVAILGLLVVFGRQLSRVSRAEKPWIAAVEAVCLVFGMFLVMFALMYVSLSLSDPGSFTERIDKVSGVYFATTILTTVGFGDIAPVSGAARTLVTVQMVLGMALIGSAFKALSFSAKQGVSVRAQQQAEASGS